MSPLLRAIALTLVGLWLPLTGPLVAQQQGPPLDPAAEEALENLAEELAERRNQLQAQQGRPEAAAALRDDIERLEREFTQLASHLDLQELQDPEQAALQLEQEILELLAPLLDALKEATAGPRELSTLRERSEQLRERRALVLRARQQSVRTRDALPAGSPARAEAQRVLDERWDPMLADLGRELLVVNANLQRREQDQVPLLDRTSDGVQSFLQSSGLNVVLCVATFLLVYFSLRWLSDRALRRKRARGFSVRLTEVLMRVVAVMAAVAATLAVLYARGDWLLLPIGVIFLVGAGWVIVKAAPVFFEQIRLILNVGPVREGERLLVDGLPYRVEALQFYSKLVNPELSGGLLRMPVKDLVGMRSRPLGHDEPWFPCKEGEVVALTDGTVGVVQLQTPEVVVVVERKDAPRSYPTVAFLSMNPRNLSHGFEVVVTFQVDYAQLPHATDAVPTALAGAVQTGLERDPQLAAPRSVQVEIEAAGDSALEYAVIVGFDGAAAAQFHELHRRVQTLLVAACVERGYGVPLPQLRLHRADDAAPPREA